MSVWGELSKMGLLGINRRNADYTLRCNPRKLFPLVDDKLKSKALCEAAGVPTPRLLGVARTQADIVPMLDALREAGPFALKPARGAMGNGIMVVREHENGRFRLSGRRFLDAADMEFHMSGIISGLYSLGGQPDAAFAEECLEIHTELQEICASGVPDMRIVILHGIPVMGMIRLPTVSSRGRANLHQGAVGAGIDLRTGRTTHAVIGNRSTAVHPDTHESVIGRLLPSFDQVLEIALRATDCTGLGYVGADVVVDERYGPLVLELNARPGLAIQIANQAGLLPRLRSVEALARPGRTLEERLELGRELGSWRA